MTQCGHEEVGGGWKVGGREGGRWEEGIEGEASDYMTVPVMISSIAPS